MSAKAKLSRQIIEDISDLCNELAVKVIYGDAPEGSTPEQQEAHDRRIDQLGGRIRRVRHWLWQEVEVAG